MKIWLYSSISRALFRIWVT